MAEEFFSLIVNQARKKRLLSRALTGTIQSMLLGIAPVTPSPFVGIAALLMAVAALAGYFPARRPSRIDPMGALRAG